MKFLLAALTLLAPAFSVHNGVPDLFTVEKQITAYYQSGRYAADTRVVDQHLQSYVDGRLKSGVRKPAVVFDIDDTALTTFPYELAHQYAYDAASWNDWERNDRFPAIPATLALAKHLTNEHVAVFFVTGRRRPQFALTQHELALAGYPQPAGLFLRPSDDHAKSVVPYKSGTRKRIEAMGYDVLASLGDQWSDLRGGYAERLFKLPNPMYYLP
jgi:acid phosphatase